MCCRKEYGLPRRFASRNDKGGRHILAPHVLATADTLPPSACHCEPVQNGNRGAPVRPGEGDAAERLKTWIFLRKSRGEGCAACIAEVWQSASPQECLASWLLFGQIRGAFQICPKYCFSFCAAARSTDCPVASLLAMTCNNLLRVRAARTYYRSNPHPPMHSR